MDIYSDALKQQYVLVPNSKNAYITKQDLAWLKRVTGDGEAVMVKGVLSFMKLVDNVSPDKTNGIGVNIALFTVIDYVCHSTVYVKLVELANKLDGSSGTYAAFYTGGA